MAGKGFMDISILGDKKLQRKLKRMDTQLQKKIVRKSMQDAMKPVKSAAKAYAPVDRGLLKRSIRTKSKSKRGTIRVSITTGTRDQLGIPATAKGYYPAAIEYGTRKQPAKPYMRRALTNKKTTILDDVKDGIAEGIRKVK